MKRAVTRRLIGTMPMAAEYALANAYLARGLRRAARLNEGHETGHPGFAVLEKAAERARARMNKYRRNRTWKFSGARGPYEG